MSDFRNSLPRIPERSLNPTDRSEYPTDEEVVFEEAPPRRRKAEQTKLQGTSLRDLLLRPFQEDFVPQESATSQPAKALTEQHQIVPDPKELSPDAVDATPTPGNSVGPLGVLARNQLIHSWTKRYRTQEGEEPLVMEGDPLVALNPTQIRAIGMMLSERLSLVQGVRGRRSP